LPAPERAVSASGLVRRGALLVAWGVVIAVFGGLEPETFLTGANFQTIFGSQAVLIVLTLGLLVPLTAGDYDLSVASVLSLSAMVLALLNVDHGWSIGWSIVGALAAGLAVGAVNGGLVVLLGLDSFVTTLGMSAVASGVVLWISGSRTIGGVSNDLVDPVVVRRFLGIPLGFYYGLGLCVVLWYVLEFTPLGRRLLFVGRGRRVARLSGVRVGRMRFGALAASGLVAAGAGVLYAGSTGGADPTSGASFLLPAFAAAFLGATGIVPGRFNPWGSFVAVYFLWTGITGLQLHGARSFVQQLFYGGALVVALVLARAVGGAEPVQPRD
jgi:ribose transport system permease protein